MVITIFRDNHLFSLFMFFWEFGCLNAWESSSGVSIMNNVHLFNNLKSAKISSLPEAETKESVGFKLFPNPVSDFFIVCMNDEVGEL